MANGKDMDTLAGSLQKVTIDSQDAHQLEMTRFEGQLSPDELVVVEKLKEIQQQHYAITTKFEEEVMELKMKYEGLYAPLYEQRKSTLFVEGAPCEAEQKSGTPALPCFWLYALKNNRLLGDLIEEADEPVLRSLKDIRVEYLTSKEQAAVEAAAGNADTWIKHPESFRLVFEFDENPFFSNTTLIKEYHLTSSNHDGLGYDGAELTSTFSTPIEWKPSKDITKKTVVRKQRNRKTKQTRSVLETVDTESFFNLFTDHEIPSDEKLDQMSDKEVQELQVVVEADYDIGITIRDKIVPRAIEWFLGEAKDDSDFDEYDEDDEFDSDEDEDEESSDEDMKGKRRH